MKAISRCCLAGCILALGMLSDADLALAEPPARSFCNVSDKGLSRIEMPPLGCSYVATEGVFQIIDGLPPGSTIEADPIFTGFECLTDPCEIWEGGMPGPEAWFSGTLILYLSGAGDFAEYSRVIEVPIEAKIHLPGGMVWFTWGSQYVTDLYDFSGVLVGDPDFESLQIQGGSLRGFPSPGRVIARARPGGAYSVDSYFDLGYQIDFVGAPGGELDGLSGSTQGTVRLEVERPPLPAGTCESADIGAGTAELPPADCKYLNHEEPMQIIDGLPPGATIEIGFVQSDFECEFVPCGQAGGDLGGEAESFDSKIQLELRGTGALAGYQRDLTLTGTQVNHSAPRTPGDPIQHFQTQMSTLTAALSGDQDFASLVLTAGSAEGLPSPGMTTLEETSGGGFLVDSFFDVDYRIDFVGAPGGVLDGLSGTTFGVAGIIAGVPEIFEDGFESGSPSAWTTQTPLP